MKVLLHQRQQLLQLAARHLELLPGVLGIVFRPEQSPQSLKGGLLALPVPQLHLQLLHHTNTHLTFQHHLTVPTQEAATAAYRQRVVVSPQRSGARLRAVNVHRAARALRAGQPQQQRVEAPMKLLKEQRRSEVVSRSEPRGRDLFKPLVERRLEDDVSNVSLFMGLV